MGLKVASIDELDPALVMAAQDQLSQLIQERYPDVELTRGVIHDVVLFLHAISGGVNQTEINRVLESRSLLAIQANPLLADTELVDHILSNYLITRKTGTRARGNITIVVEGDATMVIASDALYTANGLNFRTDTSIIARPPGTVTTDPGDRVLEPRGDGTYEFSVPATAEDVGETYNIRINTKLTPEPQPPPRFVTAFSSDDFTGGNANETNTQLVTRMEAGIAAKVTAGRINIAALIRSQAVFADMKNISIIGYGDPEMERDQHWIFPVSGGGRIDIYCQMDSLPFTVAIKRNARLIEKRTADSIWQFTIHRDDAPGFYEVAAVRRVTDPTDIAGFEVISDVRGWDFDDDVWRPDIKYVEEAAYTRYQTAVIRFVDNATPVSTLTVGDEVEYSVNILTQQRVGGVQEFLAGSGHRHLAADILVKSAVPCFVSINFDIIKDTGESSPDLDAIKVAIADRVNNLNFPGSLYVSQVLDVVHNYLTGTQAVGPVDMHGLIRRPDGSTAVIRNSTILAIPNSPSTLVTPRTTAFILYPEDIGLNVVNRSN
jgi:hypothetical protein